MVRALPAEPLDSPAPVGTLWLMTTLVLTVVGADRAGLVAAVADVVDAHGGNWENSQLAELAGAFAGIIEVSVPADRVDELRASLSRLDGLLTVSVHASDESPADADASRRFAFRVLGNDHPGIVREISSTLSAHGLSIERMSSETYDAAMAGGRLFEATIAVRAAESVDVDAVQSALEALAAEIQVMITAVTELAHLTVPGMKERGYGRIVNLSSLAAFMPPAASLLYTGIKSYVLDVSQALDMELRPYGVHVTALCPGFTHSEFHDVMGTRDAATSKLPSILWQDPEAVVREGWRAVEAGKPVCIPGVVNKVTAAAAKPIPTRLGYFLGKTLNPFKH